MLRCSNFSKGTSMPMQRLPMTLLLIINKVEAEQLPISDRGRCKVQS